MTSCKNLTSVNLNYNFSQTRSINYQFCCIFTKNIWVENSIFYKKQFLSSNSFFLPLGNQIFTYHIYIFSSFDIKKKFQVGILPCFWFIFELCMFFFSLSLGTFERSRHQISSIKKCRPEALLRYQAFQ